MQLFAFKGIGGNATIAGQAEQVQGELVSGDYYSQLGVRPIPGRAIADSDERSTVAGAVVVISYGLWERQFGRSPGVLGQVIKLNDVPLTIVGVNPQSFTGAASTMQSPDLFVPMIMQPLVRPNGAKASLLTDNVEWWVNVMGRMLPGVSEAQAQAALDAQLAAAARATLTMKPDDDLPHVDLRDGSRGLFYQQRTYAKPMTVLLTMVGFVMLLACANIANLMLARGTERQREMSVRLALGAGRARIVRQLLVESLLLACVGGVGGLMLGALGAKLIPKLTEDGWSRSDFHIHFDWTIFAFTAAITLLTGILFGLAPAIAGSRARVSSGFQEGSQSVTRRRKGWAGKSLVGFQIALSTLLVIGAGLFLRTLASLEAVNVGFRTDHLLLAEISLPQKQYPAGQDIAMHTRILEAFAATPGVEAVAPVWVTYIADSMSRTDFVIEGREAEKDKDDGEDFNIVGDNFFSLMQIPIVAGRSFATTDTATSTRVGIINATLAKERFGNQNPIGKRFSTGDAVDAHGGKLPTEWIQIVGVCADTRYMNLRDEPPAQFFMLFSQQKEVSGTLAYLFRTKGDPETVTPALRQGAAPARPRSADGQRPDAAAADCGNDPAGAHLCHADLRFRHAGAGIGGCRDLWRDGVLGGQPDERDWDSAGARRATAAGTEHDSAGVSLAVSGWSGRGSRRCAGAGAAGQVHALRLGAGRSGELDLRRGVADCCWASCELAAGSPCGFGGTDGGAAA